MKTAIITGGTRGFGLATAKALLAEGWNVVIDGRDRAMLDRAAADLGGGAHAVLGDVTDSAHREALVANAASLGSLALLVNNASTLGPTPLPRLRDLSPATLLEVQETNVLAPLALIQLALPLLEQQHGAVLNITSDAAVEGYEGWGAYGTSKAALEQLSHVLAVEEVGIRVWWLDPGDMRTEMHQAAFPGEDISDRPLPEEIAPAVLELLARWPASGRVRASDLLQRTSQ